MKNNQKGSVALWVMGLAIIIGLIAAGIYVMKNRGISASSSGNSQIETTDSQAGQPTSPITPSGSTVDMTPIDASNISCDNVFPLDIVQKNFPSGGKVTSYYKKGVGLTCDYTITDMHTFASEVSVQVIIPELSPSDFDNALDQGEQVIKSLASASSIDCTPSTIGKKSVECSYVLKGPYADQTFDQFIFITTSGKYNASVVVTQAVPVKVADQQGVTLEMTKEVDAKLSSL